MEHDKLMRHVCHLKEHFNDSDVLIKMILIDAMDVYRRFFSCPVQNRCIASFGVWHDKQFLASVQEFQRLEIFFKGPTSVRNSAGWVLCPGVFCRPLASCFWRNDVDFQVAIFVCSSCRPIEV